MLENVERKEMDRLPGIGSWLTRRQVFSPEKEALVDGERRVSYRQLNGRVNQLTRALMAEGLRYGDRIGVLAFNGIEFVEIIMAAAKLGLLLVPLNWRLTAAELSFILRDSRTETLIYDSELAALADTVMEQVPMKRVYAIGTADGKRAAAYQTLLQREGTDEPAVETSPTLETPHIIMYTAGTTGKPKGAVLSQGASFWNCLNLGSLDFTSHDRDLLVLPMFHIGGIGLFTLPMLYAGGTVVLMRTFEPAQCLRLLQTERITLFFGVPAIFLFLIQHPNFDPSAFKGVRMVMSGGAPLPVSLVKQYHEAGIPLRQGFGMSEAAPSIATLGADLALKKAGSIGRAVFHLDTRIVDDEMNDLPVGEVGELVMRGPNLMMGYWNRPEATQEAFKGGWFHSGDLARMDEEGDLWVVDRKKDMFISGGENVYPAEVENAIYELPQVSEAAVIGVRDRKWGEVGRAIVVLKPDGRLSEGEILDHLRGRLARYKIPKGVEFVPALPRNAAGKVLKIALKEQFGGE